MTFSSTVATEVLERQHPDYASVAREWEILDALNEGGYRLKRQASLFVARKWKEPEVVYQARVEAFTYENILGPILDWYRAKMAGAHAELSLMDGSTSVNDEWYAKFAEHCEAVTSRRQSSLQNFHADRFKDLILYGRAYVLVDKPVPTDTVRTQLDQRRAGLLDPYLVGVSPREVIDWAADENGDLEYCVLRTEKERRAFGEKPQTSIAWYVYTRDGFAHYEAPSENGKPGKVAALMATGAHALTASRRVPILPWVASKGQWLADRAVLSLLAHIDLLNANKWSMWNTLLPMLVIRGQFEGDAVRSEVAYLNVDANGGAEYLSPDPNVFDVAAKTLSGCKEEAYRQMHVQAQARTASATAMAQSAVSKQEDMTAAAEVLNGFGADLRGYADTVMRTVIEARGDTYHVKVSGYEFDRQETGDVIEAAERCDRLVIGSATFDKEMRKRVVRAAAADLPANLREVINREIDAAESPEDRRAAERAEAAGALKQAIKRGAAA